MANGSILGNAIAGVDPRRRRRSAFAVDPMTGLRIPGTGNLADVPSRVQPNELRPQGEFGGGGPPTSFGPLDPTMQGPTSPGPSDVPPTDGDNTPPDLTTILGNFLQNFLSAGGGGGDKGAFNLPMGLLLALTLGGGLSQLFGGGQKTTTTTNLPPSVTNLANLVAGQAPGAGAGAAGTLVPSPGELALPGATGAVTSPLGAMLAQLSGAPLDTAAFMRPIQEAFQEQVIPEIKSLGIRAGAPGGSGEQRLLEEATGRFGEDVAGVLSRAELQRRQTAGTLAPLAAQLQLGGPTAEAGLGALIRQLSTQQQLTPLQTEMDALRAIGGALPGERVTETTPGVGQVGAGVAGQIASLLILQSVLQGIGKKDGDKTTSLNLGGGTSLLGSLLGAGIKEIPDILKVILGSGDGEDSGSVLANLLSGSASTGAAGGAAGAAGIGNLLSEGGGIGASVGTGTGGEILGAGAGAGAAGGLASAFGAFLPLLGVAPFLAGHLRGARGAPERAKATSFLNEWTQQFGGLDGAINHLANDLIPSGGWNGGTEWQIVNWLMDGSGPLPQRPDLAAKIIEGWAAQPAKDATTRQAKKGRWNQFVQAQGGLQAIRGGLGQFLSAFQVQDEQGVPVNQMTGYYSPPTPEGVGGRS